MADETLVSDNPGSRRHPLIPQGQNLLKKLDESGIPITAAFWFFDSESQTWKFVLASPRVATEGPLDVYKTLQEYVGQEGLTLQDIAVVGPHEPLVDLLRSTVKTPPTAIYGIRYTANTINNVFIDDAYIYRIA